MIFRFSKEQLRNFLHVIFASGRTESLLHQKHVLFSEVQTLENCTLTLLLHTEMPAECTFELFNPVKRENVLINEPMQETWKSRIL